MNNERFITWQTYFSYLTHTTYMNNFIDIISTNKLTPASNLETQKQYVKSVYTKVYMSAINKMAFNSLANGHDFSEQGNELAIISPHFPKDVTLLFDNQLLQDEKYYYITRTESYGNLTAADYLSKGFIKILKYKKVPRRLKEIITNEYNDLKHANAVNYNSKDCIYKSFTDFTKDLTDKLLPELGFLDDIEVSKYIRGIVIKEDAYNIHKKEIDAFSNKTGVFVITLINE